MLNGAVFCNQSFYLFFFLSPGALRIRFRALWVNRKRTVMDMVDMIADGMEKKPKAVMVRVHAWQTCFASVGFSESSPYLCGEA